MFKKIILTRVASNWTQESVGNFEADLIKCRLPSCSRKVPLILRSNLAESIDGRGILSNHIRGGWLAISSLDAANLWDAISTFSYIPPQRNSYHSKGGVVDEVVRLRKGSIWGCLRVRARTSEGKWWKDPKMSGKCVWSSPSSCQYACVELCNFKDQQLSGNFWQMSHLSPFFLSVFFLPVYACLCKCLWNICCVKKK